MTFQRVRSRSRNTNVRWVISISLIVLGLLTFGVNYFENKALEASVIVDAEEAIARQVVGTYLRGFGVAFFGAGVFLAILNLNK